MQKTSILLLGFSAISAATGQLLFKIGASGRDNLSAFVNAPILLGLAFYAIGTLIWIYTLATEKLVHVYVFTALTFVLVYVAGVFILKESISGPAVVGILFVLCGLYLITAHGA